MIGSDKKHLLTPSTRNRSFDDAAGLIPLAIGAFAAPSPLNCAMYINQPIFKYSPCRGNMNTGQWANHVGESLGRVKKAMEICKIKMSDSLCRQKESNTTSLAQIIKNAEEFENKLVEKIADDKVKIANYNSYVRRLILKHLHNAHKHSDSDAPVNETKKNIRTLLIDASDARIKYLKLLPFESHSDTANEPYNGVELSFDHFYDTYIAQDPFRTNVDANFKTLIKDQEKQEIDSFLGVVRAFHAYYENFSDTNGLNSTNAATIDPENEWPSTMRPVDGPATIDDSHHKDESNALVSKEIWSILVERFEILSSVVHIFLKTYAGTGSSLLGKMSEKLVQVGIFYSFAPLFEAQSKNYSLEDLRTQKFSAGDTKSVTCQQISNFHVAAIKNLADFIGKLKLPQLSKEKKESDFLVQLDAILSAAIINKEQFPLFTLKEPLLIRDLSIPIMAKNLVSDGLDQSFDNTIESLHAWKLEGPNVVLSRYMPFNERDRLLKKIHDRMNMSLTSENISAAGILAARVILTLNRTDTSFVCLFHLPRERRAAVTVHDLFVALKNPLIHPLPDANALQSATAKLPFLNYKLPIDWTTNLKKSFLKDHQDDLKEMYKLNLKKFEKQKKSVTKALAARSTIKKKPNKSKAKKTVKAKASPATNSSNNSKASTATNNNSGKSGKAQGVKKTIDKKKKKQRKSP